MLMEFADGGGVLKVLLFALAASVLQGEELLERFVKLAGEALAVDAEQGDGAMSVDDVEIDPGLLTGRVRGAAEGLGLEERDAVLTPGGIGEVVDQVGLGGSGGAVFIEELLDVALEGGEVLSGQDGGFGRSR